jgi:hypothetical protein
MTPIAPNSAVGAHGAFARAYVMQLDVAACTGMLSSSSGPAPER